MFLNLESFHIIMVFAATFLGGFVKGGIGFAMPIVMMSALASFMPTTDALALMILPMLATNLHQSLRHGIKSAWQTMIDWRWHIVPLLGSMTVAAGYAKVIPQGIMLVSLGGPVFIYALWQVMGWPMRMSLEHPRRAEVLTGLIGGIYGGLAGIWGPPLIVLLLSLNTPKAEQVRVLGTTFLIGTTGLMLLHGATGVFDARTAPFSLVLVLPAALGIVAGFRMQDRLNLVQFRRWTLIMLMLTGANLLRRGLQIIGML